MCWCPQTAAQKKRKRRKQRNTETAKAAAAEGDDTQKAVAVHGGVSTAGALKSCVDCQRELPRCDFSNMNWKSSSSRCTTCANSTTAHPRLQAILRENHAQVLTGALEEVGLSDSDSAHLRRVWDETLEANSTLKLAPIMSAIVVNLMASLEDKAKKESFRRVWRIANETLHRILCPNQESRKKPEKQNVDPLDDPWPAGVLQGFWVTARSSGSRGNGARDEILRALEPFTQGLTFKAHAGLWKRLVFVSVTPCAPSVAAPDLNALLAELYAKGWRCQYCETVTPLQWVGLASSPPMASDCMSIIDSLLGEHAPATTFGIEYKCHDGTKGERSHWISYFADLISDKHSVDLKTPAVVINIRVFGVSGVSHLGFCVRRKAEVAQCVRDTDDYHSLGSRGAPYYRADVNLNSSAACGSTVGSQAGGGSEVSTLNIEEATSRYEAKLEAALAAADLTGAAPEGTLPSSVQARERIATASQATSSGNHKRRQRSDDSETQVQAIASRVLPLLGEGDKRWTVEFGAGKGSLSKGIQKACCDAGVTPPKSVLVDRDRGRGGRQSRVEGEDCLWSDLDGTVRLRVDISNFWLRGMEQLSGQSVVGIGKHVCGAATDLTLRCLVPREAGDGAAVSTSGVAIALCCYHLCSWDAYVNQEWVLQQGFTAAGA